jgi:murein L,D-transpeptidase YafK
VEEGYWLAVQALDAGQSVIPVHIFPARLDPSRLQWLEDTFQPEPDLLRFWHDLAPAYTFFEETRRVPWVTVGEDGRYTVPETPRMATDTVGPELPTRAGGDGDGR